MQHTVSMLSLIFFLGVLYNTGFPIFQSETHIKIVWVILFSSYFIDFFLIWGKVFDDAIKHKVPTSSSTLPSRTLPNFH